MGRRTHVRKVERSFTFRRKYRRVHYERLPHRQNCRLGPRGHSAALSSEVTRAPDRRGPQSRSADRRRDRRNRSHHRFLVTQLGVKTCGKARAVDLLRDHDESAGHDEAGPGRAKPGTALGYIRCWANGKPRWSVVGRRLAPRVPLQPRSPRHCNTTRQTRTSLSAPPGHTVESCFRPGASPGCRRRHLILPADRPATEGLRR